MDQTERHTSAYVTQLRERLAVQRRADAASGEPARPIEEAVADLVEREACVLSREFRARVAELLRREAAGLGPLEDLLADPTIEEVMVNGPDAVFIERKGRIERSAVAFGSVGQVWETIERILAPTGRRVDELSPMTDARLADGSRVNVVVPPLAVDGPLLSIRRFASRRPEPRELIASGSLDGSAAQMLEAAVADRRTILISGGTGAGKTTLLNALSTWIDPADRVVTIEDAAELQLRLPHVLRLETRPESIEGRGQVTMRDLLRNALRMRPDRIIIGEVRGPEALDLLTALNTGHAGALSTVHANSPDQAIARLETLALMAGLDLPAAAIRDQLVRGIDLIVQVHRASNGLRSVTEIARLAQPGPLEGETAVMNRIWP